MCSFLFVGRTQYTCVICIQYIILNSYIYVMQLSLSHLEGKKNIQEQCCSGGKILYLCFTHSEVVEGGVWQTTSCYVFGQLVQHLWVLGLKRQQRRDFKSQTYTKTSLYTSVNYMLSVGALTCMASILRGMSSRCCLMLKCHVFILIMSSNMNSRYKRPSTHTCSSSEDSGQFTAVGLYTEMGTSFTSAQRCKANTTCVLSGLYTGWSHCWRLSNYLTVWNPVQ